MCGIVGYTGKNNGIDLVLEGLYRLEYRGYDSVGIGFKENNTLKVVKTTNGIKGRENSLEKLLKDKDGELKYNSHIVIGHTRWATHGGVDEKNAHPHMSNSSELLIVHNGIIENYSEIKNALIEKGFKFKTETDSEVIAHLIEYLNKDDDLESAFKNSLSKLEGSFAILMISKNDDSIYGAKKGSPLVLGLGEGEMFISSDELPFVDKTNRVVYLDDFEYVILKKDGYEIKNFQGFNVEKEIKEVPFDFNAVSKGPYEHYMLKEIHEQSISIRNSFLGRIDNLSRMYSVNFPKIPRNINKIVYLGCGTSLYASMIGRYITEAMNQIPSIAEDASEFIYRKPVISKYDVYLAISQSGETADTKNALSIAMREGAYVAGMVNVVGSQIARMCGKGMYLHAGPEIGVASTKAFTSQVMAITLFNLMLSEDLYLRYKIKQEIKQIPTLIDNTINELEPIIKKYAKEISKYKHIFYLGRGINYPVALEGALKMKEISYLHSEGLSAGGMKHGPIALIDENLLSVFIITGDKTFEKTLNNLIEVKARGGRILVITDNPDRVRPHINEKDMVLRVRKVNEYLSPIINIIPLQLMAYYTAKELGREIDKPRNLAKSVTVE